MPIQPEEEEIDLDDLFEDEDFKGPNEEYKSLYSKIQSQKASRKDFLLLSPGDRGSFLIYIANAIKELTKQGFTQVDKITKVNHQRLKRLLDFLSLLEGEEIFFVIQTCGMQIIISSELIESKLLDPAIQKLGKQWHKIKP